ncbi:putative membrane protein [Nocardia nova SH22a]|uniref:Putative membrane protein n=1 Tax=Nocardia nova SH22a TaxID=1415166 RepID=W5TPU0_9NOCA|nr:glycosyltransferase 87 family protein [Nocardia nova]AHH21360.1 putative membrane protein [Nocardia nova SH22a]
MPGVRRFGRLVWLVPAVLVAISVVWLVHPSWPLLPIKREFIDLQVYRLGVQAMWDGADLYGSLPKTTAGISLPFIYPPFAAVALGPFALLPWNTAAVSFFVVATLALAVTLYLVARRVWGSGGAEVVLWASACAIPLGMLLEPVHSTLDFGQVNLLLMVLVAADCLPRRTRWPRGVLIGIAAAIKLTPAAFVLYFLVRRDYRAAITAAITGAIASGIAFALMPHESVKYWFGGMGNVSGLSGSAFRTNQSIQGVLSRFQVPEPAFTALWGLLSLALLALVVTAMRRAVADPALALAFNAVFTLLVSPISWSHHWVWIAPGLLAAVGVATRLPRRQAMIWYAIIITTAVVFTIGPQNWEPGDNNRELHWTPWQHLIGDTYVWLSVLLVAAYVFAGPRPATREPLLPESLRSLRGKVPTKS